MNNSQNSVENLPPVRPSLEIVPEKPFARFDSTTEIAVLVRITPPRLAPLATRPRLNLSLVLDRSGSMAGAKLRAAKKAAIFAVQQLSDDDWISVVAYDSDVGTVVKPIMARDKAKIIANIEAVRAGSATALHAGWLQGATHVAAHLEDGRLNRVLLLTDGLANEGVTDSDRIASDVKALAARGVSTSTLGVGDDFNEDLLQLMARMGDGNYGFIADAADLERLFAAELSGLMATVGRRVSLGFETQNGTEIVEMLSKLDKNSLGRLQLSNLVAGHTLEVALKIRVPILQKPSDVLMCRLAYDAPNQTQRQVMREALSLSPVAESQWNEAPFEPRVQSAAARLELARQREIIGQSLDAGDVQAARIGTQRARQIAAAAPLSAVEQCEEAAEFDLLEGALDEGNTQRAAKQAKFGAYRRYQSRE